METNKDAKTAYYTVLKIYWIVQTYPEIIYTLHLLLEITNYIGLHILILR